MMTGSFVYTRQLGRACAEKWPSDAPAGVKDSRIVIAAFALTAEEYVLSIDELMLRYPVPLEEKVST